MDNNNSILPSFDEAGSGRAIIMLPGMEGSRKFWRFQLDEFSSRYRVIACDYLIRSARLSRNINDYAADIVQVMDSLKIDQAALIAESFGGMVAQAITLMHPSRIAALVLCNTMDRPRRGGFGFNMFTLATMVHFSVFLAPRSCRKGMLNWVGQQRGFVMDPSPGNALLADYILEYGLTPGVNGYLDRVIAGMKARFTDQLASISVPTLIIHGLEDRVVTDDVIMELSSRIPGSELTPIEQGGHCCTYTCPETSNKAILAWFKKIKYI